MPSMPLFSSSLHSFSFTVTATTEIYTLSLHDALPISPDPRKIPDDAALFVRRQPPVYFLDEPAADRKSTRLNSSHLGISYAVFCLKKKKKKKQRTQKANNARRSPSQ